MLTLRKSRERGYADHGWLKSHHSFSFADYHDPAHMGVGNLRVINEDRIAPGTGFGSHGHRDMEIVSYVLEGALAHTDSMGHGGTGSAGGAGAAHTGVVMPGDVQRMSAGTGVRHSEFNHSKDGATHFLQIWIVPSRTGIAPGYEQKHFAPESKRGRLVTVASSSGAGGAVTIHADAHIHAGLFHGDESARLALDAARIYYVHLVRGELTVNGQRLQAGDALTLQGETSLNLTEGLNAEVLVFDLRP